MLLFRWGTNLLKKRVRLFLLIALDGMTPAESFQSPSHEGAATVGLCQTVSYVADGYSVLTGIDRCSTIAGAGMRWGCSVWLI